MLFQSLLFTALVVLGLSSSYAFEKEKVDKKEISKKEEIVENSNKKEKNEGLVMFDFKGNSLSNTDTSTLKNEISAEKDKSYYNSCFYYKGYNSGELYYSFYDEEKIKSNESSKKKFKKEDKIESKKINEKSQNERMFWTSPFGEDDIIE